MRPFNREELQPMPEVLKAMSHPTRLWMLRELAEKERCVCEFAESSGFDFSTVSKHLSILRHAGLVKDEKRGKNVYYHLRARCVTEVIACLERGTSRRNMY